MSPSQLTLADRLEIHEIPGRYGDSIDDRDWDTLRTIFTDDAIFDLTGVGSRVLAAACSCEPWSSAECGWSRSWYLS